MRIEDLKVNVVGGAIGGATAALLLANAGAEVRLIERVAQPRAVGAGIALAENGLAVLSALGFDGPLERLGREVGRARVVDGKRRVLLAPAGRTPRVLMLRRSDLLTLLLDAVAHHPRIRARFGQAALRTDRAGTVVVQDEAGAETSLAADLVIAADGVHSSVRAHGRFGAKERSGIRYVRGLLAQDVALGEEAWTSEGLFGSFAVAGGTYFYLSVGSPELQHALQARDSETFRRAWTRAYPACAPIVNAIDLDAVIVNRVHEVHCATWIDGHCVLLGDAAHGMAPNLGQGGNSAIVDAAVLLDELTRGSSLHAGLAAYEARRKPAVHEVATLSARLGRLAELRNPVLRLVRDRVLMPVANRLTSDASTARVLQEPARLLTSIARRAHARNTAQPT